MAEEFLLTQDLVILKTQSFLNILLQSSAPLVDNGIRGGRGTKAILTRYPEEVGIEPGQRHEGIKIGLTPRISHVPAYNKVGLY